MVGVLALPEFEENFSTQLRLEGEPGTAVEQRSKGVGGSDPFRADALLRPAAVVNGMIGLHGRDDAQAREAGDVLPPQVLGVLGAEPAVPRAVRRGHAVEDVEQEGVGPFADGVHDHLEPGRIGAADPGAE